MCDDNKGTKVLLGLIRRKEMEMTNILQGHQNDVLHCWSNMKVKTKLTGICDCKTRVLQYQKARYEMMGENRM